MIKQADEFKWNDVRVLQKVCASGSKVKLLWSSSANPVKFGELVTNLGLDYEEGCKPILHQLVRI